MPSLQASGRYGVMSGESLAPGGPRGPPVTVALLQSAQWAAPPRGSHRHLGRGPRLQHSRTNAFSFLAQVLSLHLPQWKTFYSWGF